MSGRNFGQLGHVAPHSAEADTGSVKAVITHLENKPTLPTLAIVTFMLIIASTYMSSKIFSSSQRFLF
jgi:hypothetical protein